jgi:hypothetical protein
MKVNDIEICEAVAKAINERDPARHAWDEHMGGGIFCVLLDGLRTGSQWMFGMSLEQWAGDYYHNGIEQDEDTELSCTTAVPSDSQDIEAIASAILGAIHTTGYWGPRKEGN